jgi:hypothetical protein
MRLAGERLSSMNWMKLAIGIDGLDSDRLLSDWRWLVPINLRPLSLSRFGLSFILPPVLSGPIELENVEVRDLMVHESIMGQIHRGAKDLPEGTVIGRFVVDGETAERPRFPSGRR